MAGEVPKTDDRGGWTPQNARRMAGVLFIAAPLVIAMVNLLPLHIQQQRAGLALSATLTDPTDPVIGRQIGDYLRELRDSTVPRMVVVADFNAVVRHVEPRKDASLVDRILWRLPNAIFAMHDESKIDVFKSAVQTPAKECIAALLDSSHSRFGNDRPSQDSATRIGDLARHLRIVSSVGTAPSEAAQSSTTVEHNLGACLLVSGGMHNFMTEYFKNESKMTPDNVEMIDFVKALSKTHESIMKSEQQNGVPCAPNLQMQAQNARQKLYVLKNSLIELENRIVRIVPEKSTEPTGVSQNLDTTRGLVESVEHDINGILATRAPPFVISSGSMIASLAIWILAVVGIFAKFAGWFRHQSHPAPRDRPSSPDGPPGG